MIEPSFRSISARSGLRQAIRCGLLCAGIFSLMSGALAGPSLPNLGSHVQGDYLQPVATKAPESHKSQSPTAPPASDQQCPSAERQYRKSLLITAFPRREPTAGKGGSLHQAEQLLPELVGERLVQRGQLWRYQQLAQSLPQADTAPARRAQQVRQLAQRADVQLVLTGELLDMAIARSGDVHSPGLVTRSRNSLVGGLRLSPNWDTRQREFVLNLQLLDGITGEPVFERQYRATGAWNPRQPHRAGFGSAAFWETHYGEQIAHTLDQASLELSETLRCQQLTSRLSPQRQSQTLMLHSGTGQGLQAGDRLPLYRLVQRAVPGQYRQYSAHLVDSGQRVTVTETQRDHSIVRLESDQPLTGFHVARTPETRSETFSLR